jgi:anaerobic selenocysteine-containing dehydrogenase
MKFTRRAFLKTSALLGASLSFLKPSSILASEKKEAKKEKSEYIPSVCNFCSTVCSIKVKVQGEGKKRRMLKIDGNENSDLNRGKMCARGQAGLFQTYDPDRIKTPLIRIEGSKRGEWKFKKATWDEAIKYIGDKLEEHKIQPWEMTMSGGWAPCVFYMPMSLGFAIATQVPNIIASPFQHCVGAGHVGNDSVIGAFNIHDEILVDWENTKYAIMPMVNAGVAAMSTSRAVRLKKAIENGAEIVVIDPRKSELASKATEWLPIKPGNDQALFLAIFSNIMKKKSYDKDFVTQYTNLPFLSYKDKTGKAVPIMELGPLVAGSRYPEAYFIYDLKSKSIKRISTKNNTNYVDASGNSVKPAMDENFNVKISDLPKDFKAPDGFKLDKNTKLETSYQLILPTLKDYTSEWASKITDIPAAKIDEMSHKLATIEGAAIDPGWMGSRYRNILQTRRLQTAIQVLIGGIDKKGGWLFAGEAHNWVNSLLKKSGNKPFIYDMMNVDLSFGDLTGLPFYIGAKNIFSQPTSWVTGMPAASFIHEGNLLADPKTHNIGSPLPAFSDKGLQEGIERTLKYKKTGEYVLKDGKLGYNKIKETIIDYNMKVIYLNGSNPIRHNFSKEKWVKMLTNKNLKLVIAVDVLPSDTTPYADIILPNSTYLERNEPFLYGNGPSHDGSLTTRFKVVDPLYDSRETPDILFKVAQVWTHKPYMKPHMIKLAYMMRDGFKKMLMPGMMGEMLPKMSSAMVNGMMKQLMPLMTPEMMRDMTPTLLEIADDKLMNSFKGMMTPDIMKAVMPGMDVKAMKSMMGMMNPKMMKSMMPGMMSKIPDDLLMKMAPKMMAAMTLDQMAKLMPGMMPALMKVIPEKMMAEMEKQMMPMMPKNIVAMMENPMSIIDTDMHFFGAIQMMTGTKTAGGKSLDAMRAMKIYHELIAKGEKNPINEAYRILSFEQGASNGMTGKQFEEEMKEVGVVLEHPKAYILEELNIPRKLRPTTISGRLEIFSELFNVVANVAGTQPEWNPMFEHVDNDMNKKLADDEFYFIFGKTPIISHASTNGNNPILAALVKQDLDSIHHIWISKGKGAKLGLKSGDKIELFNTISKQTVQGHVQLTDLVRDDTLFFPSSFGTENPLLRVAVNNGAALNEIVPDQTERLVAAYRSQEFTVKVKKIG